MIADPFREVLVPLDGSRAAERALGPALDLARRTGVPLRLLSQAPVDEAPARAGYLAALADRHRCPGGVETQVVLDRRGSVADAIWSAADPGTLVTLTSHGRTGPARALFGSVAEEVVRSLDEPALVVGPHVDPAAGFGDGRIVACLDGSRVADAVLPPAQAWSDRLGLSLWLVEVTGPGPAAAALSGGIVSEGGYLAACAAGRPGASGWEVVHDRSPEDGLVGFARATPVAALVMATHGRTGWERAALGSVTTRVVRRATVPVLVVPPGGGLLPGGAGGG